MTKQRAKVVGSIGCPFCLSVADVRQTPGKNYKFIYCPVDGVINATNYERASGYQDFIDDKMRPVIEGESQVTQVEDVPEKMPEPEPQEIEPEQHEEAETQEDDDGFIWPWQQQG